MAFFRESVSYICGTGSPNDDHDDRYVKRAATHPCIRQLNMQCALYLNTAYVFKYGSLASPLIATGTCSRFLSTYKHAFVRLTPIDLRRSASSLTRDDGRRGGRKGGCKSSILVARALH